MPSPRRAVVVDDERLPRVELCSMLAKERDLVVVGEAASLCEALDVIRSEKPDVVFLDIQLGRDTGFEVLEQSEGSFDVIFVTAYDQHAVRAFEVNAVDYLLKPVHPARLANALRRLDQPGVSREGTEAPLDASDRLFVRANERWQFVLVGTIKVIQAAGDFTRIHTTDGPSILLGKPMREWQARLPPAMFTRIHRSTIVNLEHVERVEEWSGQTFHVHVRGVAEAFEMSRRYAARLKH